MLQQTLIDRAERRLKNLNYFKTVKISTKPGSVRTASARCRGGGAVSGDFNISEVTRHRWPTRESRWRTQF